MEPNSVLIILGIILASSPTEGSGNSKTNGF